MQAWRPLQRDGLVYTDVAFEQARESYIRRTVDVALLLTAANGLWWAYFAFSFRAWPMVCVDVLGSAGALLLFAIARYRSDLPASTLAHLTVVLSVLFVWAFLLVVEGLPSDRFPTLNHWWFVAIGAGACLLFMNSIAWLTTYTLVTFVSFVISDRGLVVAPAFGPLPAESAGAMFPVMEAGVHSGVFIVVILLAGVFVASIARAEEHLSHANAALESLLGNMLPKPIADRLRQEGRTFADGYAECSVLFVDIVGFTMLTTRMPPAELVRLLDEIFSRFDEVTEDIGLEKIKTIGDAYMVAAGLPEPRPDHAGACVHLALKMRAIIREYPALKVRIGINSGSVVAGIIGKRKFIYDLWGDTVNIASRMESQGVVDEIQISATTAALLGEEFVLQPRGDIEIKGRGPLPVYLVSGTRAAHAASGLTPVSNC